ncbi:unnamed protein product [Vitrella brassicaformis CCMP3155]|uniref:Uncharacterized protein n=1 Tax=Vitrella brassicaformis (strain CCMP3155) TaxID=1169540 RepID=A0A0G4EZ80_VITBC|nr:unnamed protein product [Vitrella brassicaformis CCMP3155]|eukprot:CEM04297.1 unnamed protein product [Vitrella brassicaformis CCMP3155]
MSSAAASPPPILPPPPQRDLHRLDRLDIHSKDFHQSRTKSSSSSSASSTNRTRLSAEGRAHDGGDVDEGQQVEGWLARVQEHFAAQANKPDVDVSASRAGPVPVGRTQFTNKAKTVLSRWQVLNAFTGGRLSSASTQAEAASATPSPVHRVIQEKEVVSPTACQRISERLASDFDYVLGTVSEIRRQIDPKAKAAPPMPVSVTARPLTVVVGQEEGKGDAGGWDDDEDEEEEKKPQGVLERLAAKVEEQRLDKQLQAALDVPTSPVRGKSPPPSPTLASGRRVPTVAYKAASASDTHGKLPDVKKIQASLLGAGSSATMPVLCELAERRARDRKRSPTGSRRNYLRHNRSTTDYHRPESRQARITAGRDVQEDRYQYARRFQRWKHLQQKAIVEQWDIQTEEEQNLLASLGLEGMSTRLSARYVSIADMTSSQRSSSPSITFPRPSSAQSRRPTTCPRSPVPPSRRRDRYRESSGDEEAMSSSSYPGEDRGSMELSSLIDRKRTRFLAQVKMVQAKRGREFRGPMDIWTDDLKRPALLMKYVLAAIAMTSFKGCKDGKVRAMLRKVLVKKARAVMTTARFTQRMKQTVQIHRSWARVLRILRIWRFLYRIRQRKRYADVLVVLLRREYEKSRMQGSLFKWRWRIRRLQTTWRKFLQWKTFLRQSLSKRWMEIEVSLIKSKLGSYAQQQRRQSIVHLTQRRASIFQTLEPPVLALTPPTAAQPQPLVKDGKQPPPKTGGPPKGGGRRQSIVQPPTPGITVTPSVTADATVGAAIDATVANLMLSEEERMALIDAELYRRKQVYKRQYLDYRNDLQVYKKNYGEWEAFIGTFGVARQQMQRHSIPLTMPTPPRPYWLFTDDDLRRLVQQALADKALRQARRGSRTSPSGSPTGSPKATPKHSPKLTAFGHSRRRRSSTSPASPSGSPTGSPKASPNLVGERRRISRMPSFE